MPCFGIGRGRHRFRSWAGHWLCLVLMSPLAVSLMLSPELWLVSMSPLAVPLTLSPELWLVLMSPLAAVPVLSLESSLETQALLV